MKVENYILKTRDGRRIRVATKVTVGEKSAWPREIKFTEKLSKKEAIKQAELHMEDISYPYSVTN